MEEYVPVQIALPDVDCSSCFYSVPSFSDIPEEGPLLFCHRFPPQIILLPGGEVVQAHPEAKDPCGEHPALSRPVPH